jgi:hypothetical protein
MKTGEYIGTQHLSRREHEEDLIVDRAKELLRRDIHNKVNEALDAFKGREIAMLVVESMDFPLDVDPLSVDIDAHFVRYSMRLTVLLLNWRDAEIGDCVHAERINFPLKKETGKPVRFFVGREKRIFVFEREWWRRIV